MNRRLWGFIAILGSFLLVGTSAHAQAVHGVLKVVKGDVQIIQASDGKTVAAKIGQKVFPKDTIIAGHDSRAKIVMVDNNELNISPDSKIEIQSYDYKPEEDKKNVLLNVMYGKVRSKVSQHYEGDNHFQVKTPSAVAGVRGTDFITGYDQGSGASQVVTFQGKVAFGQPGPGGQIMNAVYVSAGQTTSSTGNKAPAPPTAVPKEQLSKMDSESNAEKSGPKTDSRQPASGPANDKGNKSSAGGSTGASNNAAPAGAGTTAAAPAGAAAPAAAPGGAGPTANSAPVAVSAPAPIANLAPTAPTSDTSSVGSAPQAAAPPPAAAPPATAANTAAPPPDAPVAAAAPATAANNSTAGAAAPPPAAAAPPMPASVSAPVLAPAPGMPAMPTTAAMPAMPPAGPPTMIISSDLPSAPIPAVAPVPTTVAITAPPPVPVALPPPTNTFINNVISNQNRKLSIVITGGP